jgi:hypothetical protein
VNVTAKTRVNTYVVRWPHDPLRANVEIFATDENDAADVVCERLIGVHPAYRTAPRPCFIPALGCEGWRFDVQAHSLTKRFALEVGEERAEVIDIAIRIADARWIR